MITLQTFTPANLPSAKGFTKLPLIGMSVKAGSFRINRSAVEKMNLKAGHCVLMNQNTVDVTEWFLEVVKDGGFVLHKKEKQSPGGLVFQSSPLARKICESVNYSGRSGHLQIGPESVKHGKQILWPLFTGKLL